MSYFDDVVEPKLYDNFVGRMIDTIYSHVERRRPMKQYIVYTDGAASNNQSVDRIGAYGYCIFTPVNGVPHKKEFVKVVPGGTNNQMELSGPIEALREILGLHPDGAAIVQFRLDSQYVITGVESVPMWKENNWRLRGKKPTSMKLTDQVKNLDLWQEFDKLLSQLSVQPVFSKIPGDNSDRWNAYCDNLCRKACGSGPKR